MTDQTKHGGGGEPRRIQLSRAKGWRMPPNTVKVDRTSKWGNPFLVAGGVTAADSVRAFRDREEAFRAMVPARHAREMDALRGRNLACWCKIHINGNPVPCHADVLLSLANDIPLEDVIRENIRREKGEAAQ